MSGLACAFEKNVRELESSSRSSPLAPLLLSIHYFHLLHLLVLTVAVGALVFDQQRAQAGLIHQARQMIGDRGADTVKSLLSNAQKPSSGVTASIIAFVTLLFGASGVFSELRDVLNIIWEAEPTNESGFLGMIKQKLFSFGMVLSVGFLLLVSLIISAGLTLLGKFFSQLLPLPALVFDIMNFAVSFVVISILFALLFKFVPARPISWRDVRVGAVGTAILFTIGKFLLGFYLGKASVGWAYGAAGSLVAVIVWVYYSAQIFFFGAEFTRVHADAHAGAGLGHHHGAPTEVDVGQVETSPEDTLNGRGAERKQHRWRPSLQELIQFRFVVVRKPGHLSEDVVVNKPCDMYVRRPVRLRRGKRRRKQRQVPKRRIGI